MKGLLERGVQKQIHRVKERLFESSKARDVTERLNNGNVVTNFRVLCVLGISSVSSLKTKLLQVSTKNCNLRPGPIPEVCDSQASCHSAHAQSKVWQVWLAENSKWLLCAYSRKLDPPPPPEVTILHVDQKECHLWGWEWPFHGKLWFTGSTCTLHTLHIQMVTWHILLILSSLLDVQFKHTQSCWHCTC